MPTTASVAWWTLSPVILWATACTPALEGGHPIPAPAARIDSLELSLFLIGDAGGKVYDDEPVLREFTRQLDSLRPGTRFVVLLGDNVYPKGIPAAEDRSRADAERRLAAQIAAIRQGGTKGFLVPGNHDWERQGKGGWNAIRRQDTLARKFGGGDVRLLPGGGCPGPVVVDVSPHIRLIALDTEWWVHNDVKPYGITSPCPTRTYNEVVDSLRGALRDRGSRHAIIVTHHPMRSGGVHGGAFGWTEHVFPLRVIRSWLWLPLPIVGSIYPLSRKLGISNQDISGKKYKAMRRAFEQVFQQYPPLVYASGHDHDLQVLRGGRRKLSSAKYLLVSGAGILGHESRVHRIDGSLFQRDAAGFMRLDVTKDGRVRLSVTTVVPAGTRRLGESNEVYSLWLTQEDRF
jgi:calcineurin-like phosphoesterase family protein